DVLSDLAADLPSISVDPEQVGQILANFVLNAAQAMPEGGTLTIETARENGGARVTISDTGVGIPPENLEKIFQPLFTTKAKGIGLGLAVAKGLAEANGGTISVASAPGRGSRFVMHFARAGEET
ncbi:MAG: ATP-binding protein, partial [Candidatus Rokuibacteriota bacterium]